MGGKIKSIDKLAELIKYNEIGGLEKYTRKLFKYRQKDRKLKRSKIKLNIRREDNGF